MILIIIGAFFFPFFFPESKLLITPDFGRSDSWNFSIPNKYLLWKSLQQNNLPLWTPLLAGGFPIFAEGQVGALFLPNLVLFKFFDFVIAYNLALFTTVVLFSLGMYVLVRTLTKNRMSALLAGTVSSLSGIVIPQLPHISLLQGFSMMPWILLAAHCLIVQATRIRVVVIAILLSMQIFAGFPQATFITLCLAGSYLLWHTRPWMKYKITIISFISAITLGLLLGATQLLPSFEFLHQSSVVDGFTPSEASFFSYPWKHFITLIDTYKLGNPKQGTYPDFSAFDGSIFWENSGFIGWVPIILVFIGLTGLIRQIKHMREKLNSTFIFFLVTCLASLFLMTGSHSPAYFVFSFWPFTLFRAPSRFLWVFILSLVILASLTLAKIQEEMTSKRKQILIICIFLVLIIGNTSQLWLTWHDYHALVPAVQWLKQPFIVPFLSHKGRLTTIGIENSHNEVFLKRGWTSIDVYEQLRNAATEDSNVFWDIPSTVVYAGRSLERQDLLHSLLLSGLTLSPAQHIATVSAFGVQMLALTNTSDIVSSWPLDSQTLQKKDTITMSKISLTRFDNPNVLPRVYLADEPSLTMGLSQVAENFQSDAFILGHSVLIHEPVEGIEKGEGTAAIIDDSDTSVRITVSQNTSQQILILTDTYYPGWTATVDGKETKIFPVNIAQRGIVIPKGNHDIIFSYRPQSLRRGIKLSVGGLIIVLILMAYPLLAGRIHNHATIPLLGLHSSGNRGQLRPRIK